MWVVEHGIWPSSENWHLFERLRQSYGELRPLEEAPGHLFSPSDTRDLATFIEAYVLFGWGFYLLTSGPRRAFLSHDEYVELVDSEPTTRAQFIVDLREAKLEVLGK